MPLLSEAMERTTAGLYRVGEGLEEILAILSRLGPRRLAQPYDAILKGALWLLATVWVDRLTGHPPVLQLLYLAPVWIAFETAGLGVAALIAFLAVPVSTIYSAEPQWGYTWDVVVRTGMMASLLTIMAYHGQRFESTQESAQRDPLTGALNRAGFEEAARSAIDASLATRGPLTVAVIDLDNFKELNDLKGHAFGDQILRTLVRSLNANLEGATIGRTGGDEFVIVDHYRSAPEVRKALAHAFDRYIDATIVLGRRSTFTVGLAQIGVDGMRYESLLEAADRDMYRNKTARFGRGGDRRTA